ncbi:RES domain-containing protein [Rhodococcoides yunnanense]|uniref:RES domain-containing protein n=1 Tax=Rhodococcoides yunnanense TaxID=278209 RepID=UPI00093210BA|nr:RES domain-containing protein [Rhodococcus yunnanensis]
MLVRRIFPYLASAKAGQPGHPEYEHHPQRGGRVDHPDYYTWYVARQPEAACGESFGNLARWVDSMFDFPMIPGARRVLGTYELPNDLRICDLDDPQRLIEQNLRPTQVVARNLSVTSTWGHQIWSQTTPAIAGRQWQAVQWYSFHRPAWTVIASWHRPRFVRQEVLALDHPAIMEAASALYRPLP